MGHDDGLGKYPIIIALGDTLTREQTNEVMLRTNRWHMLSCNDDGWCDIVTCILGHADILDANPVVGDEYRPDGIWDYQLRWDLAAQFGDNIEALKLFALDNEAIMTSCVGGPCGWLDWSGRIRARYAEGSKWTSIDEVDDDWHAIAAAFPFLRLRAQLAAGTYLNDLAAGTVGAEWIIEDGTAQRVEPSAPLVAEPRWWQRPIDQWYTYDWWDWPITWPIRQWHYRRRRRGTWPLYTTWNERCVPATRLIDAVDQVRRSACPTHSPSPTST